MRRLLAATALALVVEPFVEPHLPVLRRATVPVLPADAAPARVLHLSDLHLLPRHRRRARWVADLARLEPHLVVVTGDLWSGEDALPLLADTLRPLPPTPWHYVTGGPPKRRGPDLPWARLVQALTDRGWTDLTHRRTTKDLAGTPVTLTGTDDAHLRRDRYERGPVDGLGIAVTHTPARRLLDAFAADGHALVLAGHTHGGQLRLPGLGPLVTNCDLDRARARGLSRHREAWLHVSAGLGTSPYAPVRCCCRPEATLLELVPGRVR